MFPLTLASPSRGELTAHWTFTSWTPLRGFTRSSSVPPLPRFSQRDDKRSSVNSRLFPDHGLVPGSRALRLQRLVLDFNGTLARDGTLLPGVRARLQRRSRHLDIFVLTADTFGAARSALRGLRLRAERVRTGMDKRRFVAARDGIVADRQRAQRRVNDESGDAGKHGAR